MRAPRSVGLLPTVALLPPTVALLPPIVALLLAIPSCSSPRPATEMIIVVDADPGVRARATNVRIEVYGRARLDDPFPATAIHDLPYPVPVTTTDRWGPTVVLVPEARDPLRSYRAVAIALDSSGTEITRTSLISGYVDQVSLRFRLYLQSSCEGVDCLETQTCRDGVCVDAFVEPGDLLDGGMVEMDAGPRDGGGVDADCGDCSDGMDCTDDTCVDGTCRHTESCDDDVDCTVDGCATDGTCEHQPSDALCTGGGECAVGTCEATGCSYVPDAAMCDDGVDCTADTCALVTGCTHMPLTDVACDDGVYCNGLDRCDAGACTQNAGVPCPGGIAFCNEDTDRCTGCATMGCPPTETSGFGACVMTGPCTGERTATTTTYTCNASGSCDPNTTTDVDTAGCATMLNGTTCESPTCVTGSCGGFTGGACDESGMATQTCTPHRCMAGLCGDGTPSAMPVGCDRDTDGMACGPCASCSSGACTGTCIPDAGMDSGVDAPILLPDGGSDSGVDAPIVFPDASQDAGTDAPPFTLGDGGVCAAPCCTNPGLCTGIRPTCCPGGSGSDPNGCVMGPCR